jgi:hypothetical protein
MSRIGETFGDVVFNAMDSTSGKIALFGAFIAFGLGADYVAGQIADAGYGADKAATYLEDAGYKNPKLTGVNHLAVNLQGCGQNDEVKYNFNVTTSRNTLGHMAVCKGILKGATIRQN